MRIQLNLTIDRANDHGASAAVQQACLYERPQPASNSRKALRISSVIARASTDPGRWGRLSAFTPTVMRGSRGTTWTLRRSAARAGQPALMAAPRPDPAMGRAAGEGCTVAPGAKPHPGSPPAWP